jgi:hypothetical protein
MDSSPMGSLLLKALLSSSSGSGSSGGPNAALTMALLGALAGGGGGSAVKRMKAKPCESSRVLFAPKESMKGKEPGLVKVPSLFGCRFSLELLKKRGFDFLELRNHDASRDLASLCRRGMSIELIDTTLRDMKEALDKEGWIYAKHGSRHVKHVLIEASYHPDLRVFERVVEAMPQEMFNKGLPACNGKLAHPLFWMLSRNLVHHAEILISHGSDIKLVGSIQPTKNCHCLVERSVLFWLHVQPGLALATFAWAVDQMAKAGHLKDELDRHMVDLSSNKYIKLMHMLAQPDDQTELAYLEILLRAGADPNEEKPDGWRPLHRAACNGYLEAARLLLFYGADPTLCNEDGKTPKQLADEHKHAAISCLLADAEVAWHLKKRDAVCAKIVSAIAAGTTTAAPPASTESAPTGREESDRPKKRTRREP